MTTAWRPELLDGLKAEARAAALARRAGAEAALGLHLAGHVLRHASPPPGATVAGFWPMGGEIDIRPLLLALQGRGHRLCLPVTPRHGNPLLFRPWRFGQALARGPFGTAHPAQGEPVTPDWVLVPLLAFDRAGNRLGYGAGYYDRTLAGLPHATALGVAFACQRVAELPAGPTDVPLRRVATEAGLFESET